MLEADPNDPYGLLAWGQVLQARGDIDGAIDAHEAAVRFAPIDSHVHFALADSLRCRADHESPFFRAPTLSRAKVAAEQGLYLAPDNDAGRELLVEIMELQLADAETTRDETPMDMLPRESRHLRVRSPRETNPAVSGLLPLVATRAFWSSLWYLPILLVLTGWLIWSWISPAFTMFNLIATVVLLYGSLVVFRAWLGPRMHERRERVDF